MKRKRSFFNINLFTILITALIALMQAPTYAQAPNLDGQLDSIYFSHGYSIDYDGFYPGANATLYVIDNTSVDANNIWIAWVISKDFNDNSYGNNRHSSWPSGHEWDDLLESDLQRLDLENTCGELVLDATMDYIDGPPYHAAYTTISGYDVDMDATESIKLYINGGDWTDMAYKTSLVSNLNDFGYCTGVQTCSCGGTNLMNDSPAWSDEPNYIPAASCSNWEYDLIWELRIDRTVFQTATCPSGTLLGVATNPVELHASPSKEQVSPVKLIKASSIIGDYIWLDADRDGIQDETENGIPNVTVDLYTDPNGDGDPADGSVIFTTTTDAFGRYIFPDLGSGNYVVDVTDTNGMLTGYSLTTGSTDPHGPIALGRNEEYLDADFGYAPSDTSKAVIGDYVWSDADNDGIQDAGETGIGGVTLQLLADNDGDGNFTDVVATTTTADDGSYLFTNLDPDDYKVDVTDTGGVLSGYSLTSGPQSSSDPTETIHVEAGDVYLNADFGYYQSGLGTIGNQIWFEEDGDGTFEPANGESGVSDVTVNLIKDTNGNGVWDAGERVVSTITTTDGTYQFVGLSLDDGDGDADYLVQVTDIHDVLRRFRLSNGPNDGSDNNSQDDPYAVALTSASPTNNTADFGYWFDQASGMVGDRVWYDLDGDGIQDIGEAGIEGVTVELWRMKKQGQTWIENAKLGEVVTDASGYYFFPNLDVGNNQNNAEMYRVKVLASNWVSPGPLYGFNTTPTNLADNYDDSELLYSGGPEIDLTLDFGYSLSGGSYEIGDYVWLDGDGDGVQDAGESGFENVTLALYHDENGNGVIDDGEPIIATDTTDANGNYLLTGLANGDYIVKVTDENRILNGYTKTYGTQPWPVNISGANNYDIDFGYFRPSPTLAFISSFRVYHNGGRVVVHWETASEVGTVGFYLFRKDNSTGRYHQINKNLLTGLLEAPQGGIYRYVDNTAPVREHYTYKLVEREASGAQRSHGPFSVTINAGAAEMDEAYSRLAPMRGMYSKQPHQLPAARKSRLRARLLDQETARVRKNTQKGNEAKIALREKGLYYLDAASIANVLGVSSKQVEQRIKNHQFLLTNQGQEAAYLPANGNSGINFYGDSIASIYTNDNMYWLEKGKGSIMEPVYDIQPSPASGDETFMDSLHMEVDRYALTALFDDPEADYWVWDYISAGSSGKSFGFYPHGAAEEGTATLTVNLKGGSNTASNPDHHVKVSVNGTPIGESQWDGTDTHTFSISFSQSLFTQGQNTIEVKGVLAGGVTYSIFYVNCFDLSYHRHYQAVNNKLLCRGDGNPVITIDGFSDSNINVFDVTDPMAAKVVTGTTIDAANRVSFTPSSPDNLYLAVSTYGVQAPLSIIANKASSLKKKGNSADYVVITPEGLEEAARALTHLRQQKGLNTMLVELEDIYDEFSSGISNPEAIKEFLSYAYNNWNHNGPQYVVFAGDGTYDYKNNTGQGDNLVPPLLVNTPYGLFASDSCFGDVMGNDGVPEIAIGRLPVLTAAELQDFIDKISAYEYAGGAWTNKIIMTADNPDSGGDFPVDSNYLAGLIPSGYTVDKIYLDDFSNVNEAKQKILAGFNNGALLVNYIGHAGLDRLASEGMLKSSDVSSLQNGDMLPIMTAMTCIVGRYSIPGYDTLSEVLLLKDNGGAVAVWAPTGASLNSLARMLAEEFFQAVFLGQEKTLGSAVLKAMENYALSGAPPFMLKIYNLLGDPALEIK
ncbi:MAG: C25 family cysteine peptidase [Candidatus Aminicenantes bacterium]|jgi:hypothetical protein